MEHPNVRLIRKGYDAFARGDMETLSELFARDILWHEAGSRFELAGDYKGQEAVFATFARLQELTQGSFSVTLEDCFADDRQAVAIHTAKARYGNRLYEGREVIVFHILDGRITDAWHTVRDVDAYDEFWSPYESMLEHPNVALVRQGYEAFAAGDIDTLRERIAPDAVWHGPKVGPLAGDYVGIDAILGLFASMVQETAGSLRIDVLDVLCNDDWGTVLCTVSGSRNGRTTTVDEVHVLRLRNGQTVEFWDATTDPQATIESWS
ncbi:MAG TPA: nuclear transport factor 2 family protein [Acidimicrobiales bacterium]|nr:nuclear transport factor 2 family protein [Acidimicrobiales bacterium]